MQEIKSKDVQETKSVMCPKCKDWTDVEIGPDMVGTVFWVICDGCQYRILVEVVLAIELRDAPAAAAAKRLGEGIKAYGVTAGGINVKD